MLTSSLSINLTPEPRNILKEGILLCFCPFHVRENKRRWRLLLTATFRETSVKQSVPDPLWILLPITLLFPTMTLNSLSTKPKTKVRKIVIYQENYPDFYYKRKNPFNRAKSQLKSSIWAPSQIRRKSRSALIWKAVSRESWFRCCMIMWKYFLGLMKIFLGWILTSWFIVFRQKKTVRLSGKRISA